MTFEEAQSQVENLVGDLNIPLGVEGALLNIVEKLQTQYAPTIKMTKKQKDWFLFNKKQGFAFAETVADIYRDEVVMTIHDDKFWGADMTEEMLMQAWLHPNSIETID